MDEQMSLLEISPEYAAFVEKFKPKKTTDDCYTPPTVYDAVKKWACNRYHINPDKIVRPFYPGGDYERFFYPEGCIVLDNPPFSILQKICNFYLEKKISFFLFAPSLTSFSGLNAMQITHIICDASITYENGAVVRTAFVTNLGEDIVAQSAPDLYEAINQANSAALAARKGKESLPKYEYPDHVLTAAMMQRYAKYGVEFTVRRSDCVKIDALDTQKRFGKKIFGSGLLLSDQAAAEKAAAESAVKWTLSDCELAIVRSLSQGGINGQK